MMEEHNIVYVDKEKPNFEFWKKSYGICDDCGSDVILVDRESWMDDCVIVINLGG